MPDVEQASVAGDLTTAVYAISPDAARAYVASLKERFDKAKLYANATRLEWAEAHHALEIVEKVKPGGTS